MRFQGSGEAELAPKGSGETEPAPLGSGEAMVMFFNRPDELIVDDHQFPFFGYSNINIRHYEFRKAKPSYNLERRE
jgi:hypothetical protein